MINRISLSVQSWEESVRLQELAHINLKKISKRRMYSDARRSWRKAHRSVESIRLESSERCDERRNLNKVEKYDSISPYNLQLNLTLPIINRLVFKTANMIKTANKKGGFSFICRPNTLLIYPSFALFENYRPKHSFYTGFYSKA